VPDLWPLRRPAGDRRLKVPLGASRIAVGLLGGDAGPDVVVDGAALAAAADEPDPAGADALGGVARRLGTESQGGAVLLGVNGVVVVGHGSSSPAAVASCIGAAASAAREGLVPRLTAALIAHRRAEPPPSRLMPA
jgi:fatty acid/phospholipid biosynthesis enzyme